MDNLKYLGITLELNFHTQPTLNSCHNSAVFYISYKELPCDYKYELNV